MMNRNDELNKLKSVLMNKIKTENDFRYNDLSVDEIMKTVIDSSLKGKYIFWVLREYLKGNIQRFEDMGRVKQALTLFKNNLSKFTEQQKQLNKISFQELENLVEPYQNALTQNAIKRIQKEKIWEDIDVVYDTSDVKIMIPKTEQASIFLGQGTKWCTASVNNNMFDYYNKQGPLYVIMLDKKDKNGRQIKYQFHFESSQFMDIRDRAISDKLFSQLMLFFEKILPENVVLDLIRSEKYAGFDEKNFSSEMKSKSLIHFCYFNSSFSQKAQQIKNSLSIDIKNIYHEYLSYMLKDFDMNFEKIDENTYKYFEENFNILFAKQLLANGFEISEKTMNKIIEKGENFYFSYAFDNEKLFDEIISKNIDNLNRMTFKKITKKNALWLINKLLDNNISLKRVNEKILRYMNNEQFLRAIKNNPGDISLYQHDIHHEIYNDVYEIYKKSIVDGKLSVSKFTYIPENFRTKSIYETIILHDEYFSDIKDFLPTEVSVNALYKYRHSGNLSTFKQIFLKTIDKKHITQDLCEKLIKVEPSCIMHVPFNLFNLDFFKKALRINPDILFYFERYPRKIKYSFTEDDYRIILQRIQNSKEIYSSFAFNDLFVNLKRNNENIKMFKKFIDEGLDIYPCYNMYQYFSVHQSTEKCYNFFEKQAKNLFLTDYYPAFKKEQKNKLFEIFIDEAVKTKNIDKMKYIAHLHGRLFGYGEKQNSETCSFYVLQSILKYFGDNYQSNNSSDLCDYIHEKNYFQDYIKSLKCDIIESGLKFVLKDFYSAVIANNINKEHNLKIHKENKHDI